MSKKMAAHAGAKASIWHQLAKLGPLRLTLGGVALAGVGAAATSAGWTGNVIFGGPDTTNVKASAFVLEASNDATSCSDASAHWASTTSATGVTGATVDSAGNLQLPFNTSLNNLLPGVSTTSTYYIRNSSNSTLTANLALSSATAAGEVFFGSGNSASTATINTGFGTAWTPYTGGGTAANAGVTVSSMALAGVSGATVTSLNKSQCATLTVTVTSPSNWAYSYQGKSGKLTVTVSGQSTTTATS